MSGGTWAAHALQHVNLLLVLFAGACLATGARLRWDPSAYVPLRELLPFEYRVLAGAVPAAGAAMLALAHLGLVAATPRRALLYTYASLMVVAMALEVALVAWVGARAAAFMTSPEAEELEQILATREYLRPLLQHLARWHTIPDHLGALIEEAEADVPWNGYLATTTFATLLLLQLLAVVFAILAARAARSKSSGHVNALSASRMSLVDSIRSSVRSRSTAPATPASVRSSRSGGSDEWAPLRAKYKNGRIVPV